jgi:signal transduction histidine kinase
MEKLFDCPPVINYLTDDDKQQFFDLFSEAPVGMGIFSGPHHVFEIINKKYFELIGMQDVIGKPVAEVFPQLVEQGFVDRLNQVYQTGITYTENERLAKLTMPPTAKPSNYYFNYVYQARKNKEGKIDGIIFFIIDVTEQVSYRKKIEQSEMNLKEAQSLGHIANFETELATGNVTWSDEQFNQLGYSKDEITPNSELYLSMVHPDDAAEVYKSYSNAFETLQNSHSNYRMILRDGSIKHIYTKWKFEFDKKGIPLKLFGINQDVTEAKLAEMQVKSLNESLERKVKERTLELTEANRELETFNSSVSHDLQTPLRAIQMFSQVLLEDYSAKIDEDGKQHLKSISRSITQMHQLVNGLLQFSKLGKVKLVKSEVKMQEMIKEIVDESTQANQLFTHEIILNKIPDAICDALLIKQVWTNLISNAVKYSSKNEKPFVTIGSNDLNGETVYYVKDNGVGFNMKFVHKLFNAFERLHNEEFEGTGIGLSNAQRIVNRHGGRIWAEGEEDKGASFYFTLGG